jgi:hypothetical protein
MDTSVGRVVVLLQYKVLDGTGSWEHWTIDPDRLLNPPDELPPPASWFSGAGRRAQHHWSSGGGSSSGLLSFDNACRNKTFTLASVPPLFRGGGFRWTPLSDYSTEATGTFECRMDDASGAHALERLSDLGAYLRQRQLVHRRLLALHQAYDEKRRLSRWSLTIGCTRTAAKRFSFDAVNSLDAGFAASARFRRRSVILVVSFEVLWKNRSNVQSAVQKCRGVSLSSIGKLCAGSLASKKRPF